MASWSTSGNNQGIPNNTILNAISSNIFTAKSTIPNDGQLLTKTRANQYLYIDTSVAGYASRASNQLIVKSVLSSTIAPVSANYSSVNCFAACNGGSAVTVYSNNLAVNGTLWEDQQLLTPAADGYYSIGGNCYAQTTPVVACNASTSYSGGAGFASYTINLGSGTGTVTLTYNAQNVPDRWRVVWGGIEVINTGFRGDAANNAALNAAGFPSVVGPGSGSTTFSKNASSPTNATVYVDAPLTGTAWSFTLSCPV
jgi:hypothetical protein